MKNLKINYQIFDYQEEKLNFILEDETLRKNLNAVILGDFACIYRLQSLLNNKNKLAQTTQKLKQKNIPFYLQLPLIVKENEMPKTKAIIDDNFDNFEGFLTGDLGLLDYLDKKNKTAEKAAAIIYISNVLNKEFSQYLNDNFSLTAIRPLMPKRVFIEEEINFPKDILIYGNQLINCATFCFHSNDMLKNCSLNCNDIKTFTMQNQKLHLVGRSFLTEKIWDQCSRIKHIKDISYTTILDFNLSVKNIIKGFTKITNETF